MTLLVFKTCVSQRCCDGWVRFPFASARHLLTLSQIKHLTQIAHCPLGNKNSETPVAGVVGRRKATFEDPLKNPLLSDGGGPAPGRVSSLVYNPAECLMALAPEAVKKLN